MNEYEALFRQGHEEGHFGWEVKEMPPPEVFLELGRRERDEIYEHERRSRELRQEATYRYAWAIPNDEAIAAIAALSPIVEIGAGTGYWAHLLRQAGADIQAFDTRVIGRWDRDRHFGPLKRAYFPVARGSVDRAMRYYRDRTLLMIWPPYEGDWPAAAVRATTAEYVVHVGEGAGGCTGTPEMNYLLSGETGWWDKGEEPAYESEPPLFELHAEGTIPQWPMIHDYVQIYKRLRG